MNNEKTSINWYPGHMAKTKRLITENINMIDIIYEVIDSRIPHSSKISDIENFTKNKIKILVMTKYDLCDTTVTDKWIKHYEELGYNVIAVNLESNFKIKPLIDLTNNILKDKRESEEKKGMLKRKARVLVVGVPNVGKSTLINRLVGKKVVSVGNKPGITKQLSWIRISDELELLDSPGILWPKIDEGNIALNLAAFTAIKEEVIPIHEVVEYILRTLETYYPKKLEERYKITSVDEDIWDTYEKIGKLRGALIKGGEVDYDKVANIIINDIKNGSIKGITFDRI